jgi:CHAD domain-containing protein
VTDVHVEIERKYDVEETFVLPDLTGLPGVASAAGPVEHTLEASYYDTPDLRLARARVTLRRRTGGTDAGWHVKLPAAAGARRELHSPLGRATRTPPKAVLAPVLGIIRSAPVIQVALLRTRRLVTELCDADGRVLAEIADDQVTGTALPAELGEAAVVSAWREVEVELVDGDEELLAAAGAALVAAGAEAGRSPSKLSRVLADRLATHTSPAPQVTDVAAVPEPAADTAGGKKGAKGKQGKKGNKKGKQKGTAAGRVTGTAGDVLRAALVDRVSSLQDADLMVRTDQPDGVHQLRVACRRLRSILAAFRPILDREATEHVRGELKWIGAELAGSRDAEVAVAHLRELVAAQPPELVLGPVAARLQQEDLRDEQAGTEEARRTLASPRYLQALDALAELVADPPLNERATEPAAPAVAAVLAHTGTRLRHLVDAARGADHPEALHDVRKATKRLRYTAEVAEPVLGAPVTELIRTLKDVQQVLGDRQDTFLTREVCIRLGLQAFAAGENAWTYGRLHGLEEARCTEAEREFWLRWPALRGALTTRSA